MARIPQRQRDLAELQGLLRTVVRGLWRRRGPHLDLGDHHHRLGRRHVAVLVHIATEGPRTVSELARDLGLSLPATSKLARELEDDLLVHRSEDVGDRRRTVVDLNAQTSARVQEWLAARNRPLDAALDALSPDERVAFFKGLRALTTALGDEPEHEHSHGRHHRGHRRRPE